MDLERPFLRSVDDLERALLEDPVDKIRCRAALATVRERGSAILADEKVPLTRPRSEWCTALRDQARDDLVAAEIIARSGGPATVLAMLLQMVLEKTAKAALAHTDASAFEAYRRSHTAATVLVKVIRNHGSFVKLRYRWKEILPLVEGLERAHPALAPGGPHLEYPWESEHSVQLPRSLPIVAELQDPLRPRAPLLLRFARELLDDFDKIFA